MQVIHENDSELVAIDNDRIFVVNKSAIDSDSMEIGHSFWKGVCLPVTRISIYGKSIIAEVRLITK